MYSNSSSFVLVFFLYRIQVSLKETIFVKIAVIRSHFDKNHFIFLLIYSYSCEERYLKCSFFFFYILFLYGLSQEVGYSSLCFTVGPCCLSVLNVIVCILSTPYSQPILLFPRPLGNHKSHLYVCESVKYDVLIHVHIAKSANQHIHHFI